MNQSVQRSVLTTTRTLFKLYLPTLYWYAGIIILVYAAITVGLYWGTGNLDSSTWETSASSIKSFVGVMGILMTPLFLPLLVNHGKTRRSFHFGGVWLGIWLTVLSGLFMVVGYGLESVIYSLNGWDNSLKNPHLFEVISPSVLLFLEYFIIALSYFFIGWLIGSMFYRYGWKIGLLSIPAFLLLLAGTEMILSIDWVGRGMLAAGVERLAEPLSILACLGLIVIAACWNYFILRDVPIRRKAG